MMLASDQDTIFDNIPQSEYNSGLAINSNNVVNGHLGYVSGFDLYDGGGPVDGWALSVAMKLKDSVILTGNDSFKYVLRGKDNSMPGTEGHVSANSFEDGTYICHLIFDSRKGMYPSKYMLDTYLVRGQEEKLIISYDLSGLTYELMPTMAISGIDEEGKYIKNTEFDDHMKDFYAVNHKMYGCVLWNFYNLYNIRKNPNAATSYAFPKNYWFPFHVRRDPSFPIGIEYWGFIVDRSDNSEIAYMGPANYTYTHKGDDEFDLGCIEWSRLGYRDNFNGLRLLLYHYDSSTMDLLDHKTLLDKEPDNWYDLDGLYLEYVEDRNEEILKDGLSNDGTIYGHPITNYQADIKIDNENVITGTLHPYMETSIYSREKLYYMAIPISSDIVSVEHVTYDNGVWSSAPMTYLLNTDENCLKVNGTAYNTLVFIMANSSLVKYGVDRIEFRGRDSEGNSVAYGYRVNNLVYE